ncbi:DUF4384 domain-containing protein [Candidatus Spongiihabitans sp.]|uniref:DUF4384 domain-containing protein n=1 Tax=Candidatus Spongiihabitans sp. TaxID=3101308 RepID=UPI003C7D7573
MKTIIKSITDRSVRHAVWVAVCVSLIQVASMPLAQAGDVDSYLKDLDIRQVPMAQIESPQATSEISSSNLKVVASVDRVDRTYRNGENVVLTVTTTEDAYLWIFDTGTSGKVHQIFPNQYTKENFVQANSPTTIPSDEYNFVVSYPEGTELLTVIASASDAPLTDKLVAGVTGPFLALNGTAESVAKDLSVSLSDQHPIWDKDVLLFHIK